MTWTLRKIEVARQCGGCRRTVSLADASDNWKCPNGCVITNGFISRIVDLATGERPVVGDCFYRPDYLRDERYKRDLAPRYWSQNAHRPPITVVLPGTFWWCVDTMACDSEHGNYGEGWTVTGDIPALTCAPSINASGTYHGYVQTGMITNDCKGRQFDAAGERVS